MKPSLLHENVFNLWQNLADFFLEWEMFQTHVIDSIKAHILCSVTFFWKSCHLWDSVKIYGRAREATNDVTIWRIRLACWISKATHTHHAHAQAPGHPHTCRYASTHAGTHESARTQTYVILIDFPLQQWFANLPHCCSIRTLPVLLILDLLICIWIS